MIARHTHYPVALTASRRHAALSRRLVKAETAPAVNSGDIGEKIAAAKLAGDNAWMLTASALVLLMTAPGLAMFYGGLVRKKNVLGVMMQCVFLMGIDQRHLVALWLFVGIWRLGRSKERELQSVDRQRRVPAHAERPAKLG